MSIRLPAGPPGALPVDESASAAESPPHSTNPIEFAAAFVARRATSHDSISRWAAATPVGGGVKAVHNFSDIWNDNILSEAEFVAIG
ncbi:hypothetical protein ABZW96_13410 [Nocardia sp. NPDC004168]|uniref:hypothetical protein n=1 Tax=Nocardia sp. NPDC004168 TaxID=3154452 RepID=UPI0033A25960